MMDHQDDDGANKKSALTVRRKKGTALLDLKGVPDQEPILKSTGYDQNWERKDNTRKRLINETASKYMGVYLDANNHKWKAQIMIHKRVRSLGYYKTDLEAAKVYAKAVVKYKPPNVSPGQVFGPIDLRQVPEQPLILSAQKNSAIKYKGVKALRKPNKVVRYQPRICYRGKYIYMGAYDTPEEAARIHAKAQFFIIHRKTEHESHGKDDGKDVSSLISTKRKEGQVGPAKAGAKRAAEYEIDTITQRADVDGNRTEEGRKEHNGPPSATPRGLARGFWC
jgi:hypothetical protein